MFLSGIHVVLNRETMDSRQGHSGMTMGYSLLLATLITMLTPSLSRALTLEECYAKALVQSEALQIQGEDLKQAEAQYRQALSGILPNLKFNLTSLIQDTENTGNSGGSSNTALRRETTISKFSLKQPLFKGLKELSAMSGAKMDLSRRDWLYKRARVNLYQDVAQAYYLVQFLEKERDNIQTQITQTKDRISELNARTRLGKSRDSEVLTAESQLLSVQADDAAEEGKIATARDLLSFFVGEDVITTQLTPMTNSVPQLPPPDISLAKALARSDMKAAEDDVLVRKYGVRFARSGYSPLLDVTGNYYVHRPGVLKDTDWDLLFNLDVPLFQGGAVKADVQNALSSYRQAKLARQQLERQIRQLVHQAEAKLSDTLAQAKILEKEKKKAKKSYDAQVKEYRLGLVNNLDVLAALNALTNIKQNRDRAHIQSWMEWVNLQAATEETP